jgi:arylsulfatase A-like enzyme
MTRSQKNERRFPGVAIFVALVVIAAASTAFAWQDSDLPNSKPPASRLRSPLLEGLRNTIRESQPIQESGGESTLLDQLEYADQILADAKAQNRYALKLIARQARIGRAARSPNILLLTVDRLALGDPGCCGQKTIQTPNIDKLARIGMRLTQFHSGAPELKPSRWSLLTGQMLHRLPQNLPSRFSIREEHVTLADALWNAGYQTAFFGFWRNGDTPLSHGFENWSGHLKAGDAMDDFPGSIHVDGARVRIVGNADGGKRVSGTKMLSSELKSWLLHQRGQRRQFFVHFAVSQFADLEAEDSASVMSADEYRSRVERADHSVGQVLKTLEETRMGRRTIVVLTAESGPHQRCHEAVAELGSTGDARTSREGLCNGDLLVPCIVSWPGQVMDGSTSHYRCASWDLMPTFLALAVARDRVVTDGVSLDATLRGRDQKVHPLMYWGVGRNGASHQAALKNGWKAFKAARTPMVRLYRMSDDPAERVDLAADFPDVLAGLIKR